MKHRAPKISLMRHRRGATLVESSVVLSVVLLILIGCLDLGLAVLNTNNLTDAAQQVSRSAVVRGKNTSQKLSVWGPASFSGTAASNGEPAAVAAANLIIMPKAKVNVLVEWPDGDCRDGDRVRTTLTYTQTMLVPGLFGLSSLPLTAVSTMRIVN